MAAAAITHNTPTLTTHNSQLTTHNSLLFFSPPFSLPSQAVRQPDKQTSHSASASTFRGYNGIKRYRGQTTTLDAASESALDTIEGLHDGGEISVVKQAAANEQLLEHTSHNFRSTVHLKIDNAHRPLWVCPNGAILLEATSSFFQVAAEFLVAVAEPVSRPECIHHYKLTPYSLYAAVSVNLDTETILAVLDRLGKNETPPCVVKFIRNCTSTFGKVKLVLKRNRLWLESPFPEVLKKLLENPTIRRARVKHLSFAGPAAGAAGGGAIVNDEFTRVEAAQEERAAVAADFDAIEQIEVERMKREQAQDDDEDEEKGQSQINMKVEQPWHVMLKNEEEESGQDSKRRKSEDGEEEDEGDGNQGKKNSVVSFEVMSKEIESVKEAAYLMNYPLMEEYDFRKDDINPDLPIVLTGKIRYYQEKALGKMFGNGRARSGLIVLPCGAGKTLTGITACCTIKKSCVVFCSSGVAVEQWIRQFQLFTRLDPTHIRRFTADSKDELNPNGATLLVTTYSMMTFGGERDARGKKIVEQIKRTDWGLMLMDEVHVVPAKIFRRALSIVKAHCKLGLTATLVREDNLITDLNFLVGPKLFEANWLKLTDDGFLARVLCCEVWCPMQPKFYKEYLEATSAKRRQLLYIMNPNKYTYCKILMQYHTKRGDKCLIFSDNIPALKDYAYLLQVHMMHGGTSEEERETLLRRFRGDAREGETEINALLISRIGDVAIDLPQCNIIIQIASHFGSRRQEAQRLGRILRPKPGTRFGSGYNAFFYTLVSTDTEEMYYSNKRQQYLVDQGYTFKVVRNLDQVARQDGQTVSHVPDADIPIWLQRINGYNAGEKEVFTSKYTNDDITNGRGQG